MLVDSLRVQNFNALRALSDAERVAYNDYMNPLYFVVNAKYPHSQWCELETGLWHSCDCGASDERETALDKITNVWLKRRGKL